LPQEISFLPQKICYEKCRLNLIRAAFFYEVWMMKETLDTLSIGQLRFLQAEKGYRYSLDPILLAHFSADRAKGQVVDLGTGGGILPLLLSHLGNADVLTGIELQPTLVERARRNVELNALTGQVTILDGDIRKIKSLLPAGSADLVVANPPYRKVGSGRIAPDDERAAARHELAGGLREFTAAAGWLLKHGGSFCLIYLAERLSELLIEMVGAGIEPKRLRMIHSRRGEEAKLVLVEGRKGGRPGLIVEKPLTLYRDGSTGRDYSDEVLQMYDPPSG
jgi:tRNA1Val (adenine37-N6)-methyltransferase